MKKMIVIKNKIKKNLLAYPTLMRHFQYIYNAIFNNGRLMRRKSFGNLNPEKTILVIRPNSEDGIQGLMSLFIQSMRWFEYADRKGYCGFVDFLNYKTQYYNGKENIWDYFFTQQLDINDVYKSNRVILSGCTWNENVNTNLYRNQIFYDKQMLKHCHMVIEKHIVLSEEVKELLNAEADRINISECLGVYIRGTDYVRLKPSGEFVQPDIEDVIDKTKEFLIEHDNPSIFLVTEDGDYYKKLKKEFGDNLKITSFDGFIDNYKGEDYLSKSNILNENKHIRGLEYFVKILLLSRCKYLISSITAGSLAAYAFNGGEYENAYVFDLGLYE